MFFNSYRNKSGLTGGNIKDGFGLGHRAEYKWNLDEKWRHLGVEKEADAKAIRAQDDAALNFNSGYTVHAKTPDGKDLIEPVPMEFHGRTYMVGKDGIKLVNEKLLDEIVTESIERENHISDVCSLFLYSGDVAVKVVSKALYDEMAKKDVVTPAGIFNCLPSTIRTTTDTALYGQLYLAMKQKVVKVIDSVVIPEETLEKARHVKRQEIDAKQVRTTEGE